MERRFCAQCGERRLPRYRDPKCSEERCGDCSKTPVPARFCQESGRRIDPPPPAPRPLLSSYLGGCIEGPATHLPGRGANHLPLNEGLMVKTRDGRL